MNPSISLGLYRWLWSQPSCNRLGTWNVFAPVLRRFLGGNHFPDALRRGHCKSPGHLRPYGHRMWCFFMTNSRRRPLLRRWEEMRCRGLRFVARGTNVCLCVCVFPHINWHLLAIGHVSLHQLLACLQVGELLRRTEIRTLCCVLAALTYYSGTYLLFSFICCACLFTGVCCFLEWRTLADNIDQVPSIGIPCVSRKKRKVPRSISPVDASISNVWLVSPRSYLYGLATCGSPKTPRCGV